jgi:hypothetical protein
MQQSLRWNTTHVQAYATQRGIALNQGYPQTEVRRSKSRRVTTGAGADYHNVEIE